MRLYADFRMSRVAQFALSGATITVSIYVDHICVWLGMEGLKMEAKTVPVNVAAACLGIGRTSLYRCINAGSLDVIHVGRRTLVTTASIARLIALGGC